MLTLQEYSEKVNKLLIFCFPIFALICMFFVSQMPVITELKAPPPKMEKLLLYGLKPTRVRHTTYSRNNMRQKCVGNCGLWVLNEIIKNK